MCENIPSKEVTFNPILYFLLFQESHNEFEVYVDFEVNV